MSLDYVSRCPKCGGIETWIAEARAKEEVREISAAVKRGSSVERIDTEEARTAKWCDCHREKEATPSLFDDAAEANS